MCSTLTRHRLFSLLDAFCASVTGVLHQGRLTEAPVSRARIARLMSEPGIAPRRKRAFIPRTTVADPSAPPAPNLLLERPPTTGINQVWVTDITYIPTGEGWLYPNAVKDSAAV